MSKQSPLGDHDRAKGDATKALIEQLAAIAQPDVVGDSADDYGEQAANTTQLEDAEVGFRELAAAVVADMTAITLLRQSLDAGSSVAPQVSWEIALNPEELGLQSPEDAVLRVVSDPGMLTPADRAKFLELLARIHETRLARELDDLAAEAVAIRRMMRPPDSKAPEADDHAEHDHAEET